MFGLGEDAGGFDVVLGVGEGRTGVVGVEAGVDQEFEKCFEGVDLAADAFWGIAFGGKVGDKFFQMDGLNRGGLGDAAFFEEFVQLAEIAVVSDGGGGRPAVVFEMGDKLL